MHWAAADVAEVAARWDVHATAAVRRTSSSDLLMGESSGRPDVRKVARIEEEARGARLLAHWAGRGAIEVLRADDHAVLMRRADGARDLATLSRTGNDEAATEALATVVTVLHAVPAPARGAVRSCR